MRALRGRLFRAGVRLLITITVPVEIAERARKTESAAATAAFRIQRRGHTVGHGVIARRRGYVTHRRLPRVPRGRYTITITVGRSGHRTTLWRERVTVR